MGSALEKHTEGRDLPAVRFYAKLGGQAPPVGPATARVLAGSSGGSVRGLRDTGACIGSLLNKTPAAKR